MPDQIDIAVGARVRIRRHWMGFSQTQLANALGITFQQVQKYERGANRISASMLVKIAAKLETSVAALVGEGETEKTTGTMMQHLSVEGVPELLEGFAKMNGDQRLSVLTVVRAIVGSSALRRARSAEREAVHAG